jgi:predicted secreted protein
MTNKLEIETRLDRSLQNQVAAPRLDGRFDAAVWKRIAAEEQRARQPAVGARSAAASGSARWMFITNVIGIAVAALLVIFFGMKAFSGVNVTLDVPVPQVSPTTIKEVVAVLVQTTTLAAVIFGLMFTPLGRRLKSIFT